jgi:ankyrin repeat protein
MKKGSFMTIPHKNHFFAALSLLAITINIYAMEPAEKPKKKNKAQRFQRWVQNVGQNMLAIIPFSNVEQDPSFTIEIPSDTRSEIIKFLIEYNLGDSLPTVSRMISGLAQVDHRLNALINNQSFCLQLIKHLSHRFNYSNLAICRALQIKQARIQENIQTDFLKLCQEKEPKKISFTTLCSQGLDIEFTSDYKHQEVTPLMLAILLDNRSVFSYLLHAGANINHANRYGTTPLMIAVTFNNNAPSSSGKNLPSAIEQLITNPTLIVDQTNSRGDTALILGIRLQVPLLKLELLLGAGADPEAKNKAGETPLSLARALHNQEFIDLIEDAIAKKHAQ